MKKWPGFVLLVVFAAASAGHGFPGAQELPFKLPGRLPRLDDLVGSKATLTSSLKDAVTEVPFLDGYAPRGFEPLSSQPRGTDGTFRPQYGGDFIIEAESYCLKIGTHGPSRGDGYALVPLKGARAGIIRNILYRAAIHPDISQDDIQTLIWAVLSRTSPADLSAETIRTARALLTPQELLQAGDGALRPLAQDALDEIVSRLPEDAKKIIRAEADMRDALGQAETSYEELQRIAVLAGAAPPQEGGRVIPNARWSFHPKGYFIRTIHKSYELSVVEISLPEALTVERDAAGRILAFGRTRGERIEIEYDDAGGSIEIPGDSAVRAGRIKTVRLAYEYPQKIGRIVEAECPEPGWILAGVPKGKGRPPAGQLSFPGLKERYAAALNHRRELENLFNGLKAYGLKIDAKSLTAGQWRDLTSAHHLVEALKEAAASGKLKAPDWMTDPVELAYRVWQFEVARAAGCRVRPSRPAPETLKAKKEFGFVGQPNEEFLRGPAAPGGPGRSGFPGFDFIRPAGMAMEGQGDEGEFEGIDLSPDGGQPGNPGSQRQGYSNRNTKMDDTCAGTYAGCKLLAWDAYGKSFADCMEMNADVENPSLQQRNRQRECFRESEQAFKNDMRDCATIAQHCLEH